MNKLICFLIAGALLLPALATAQDAAPAVLKLDVKTALGLAEKNSFSLMGGRIDLDNKKTAAETAWSVFYPTASLSGSFAAGVTDPTTSSASRNKLSVGLTAGLALMPTLVFNVKSLWNDYATGLASFEQTKAKLDTDVKKYYFGLLLLTQQLALLKNQAGAAAKRFEAADFRFKNGFLSEIDKLTVEYAWKDRLFTLQTVQNNFDNSLRQLKDVCGIDPAQPIELADALPDTTALKPAVSGYTLDNNQDLKLLGLTRTQAEIQRDTALAALLPTVTVGGKLAAGFSADPIATSPFDASSWSWADSIGLTVNVTVPLDAYLPFSSTQRALATQNAAVEKAGYAIASQTQALKRQADSLSLTLAQTAGQIEALQLNIDLARKTLSLTEQLYTAGKKSFLDLKDAENSLANAQLQLLSAQNSYLTSYLDLQFLLNTDLGL